MLSSSSRRSIISRLFILSSERRPQRYTGICLHGMRQVQIREYVLDADLMLG